MQDSDEGAGVMFSIDGKQKTYQGRRIAVFEQEVVMPNGERTKREVVEQANGVAILALDHQGNVVMVRQWRAGVDKALWELPAGSLDLGLTPYLQAEAELKEETGFRAGSLVEMGRVGIGPPWTNAYIHYFLATDLTAGEAEPEAEEFFQIGIKSRAEITEMIALGELDMKVVVALFLYEAQGQKSLSLGTGPK